MRKDAPRIPEHRMVTRNTDCPSNKLVYPSKSAAKRKARTIPADDRGKMSAYRCPEPDTVCAGFHVGHLPSVVKTGEVARSELRHVKSSR